MKKTDYIFTVGCPTQSGLFSFACLDDTILFPLQFSFLCFSLKKHLGFIHWLLPSDTSASLLPHHANDERTYDNLKPPVPRAQALD